ncbi:GIY-YIG nuclease family protein [Rhizobium sp. Root482]|uniref:GIY-YIG nuclease family protein n=1 Tax=Rhizobium sp. Root482 TaxID=1736543 RepID=UPI0006F1DF2F|nr:GIY-YIG nuclease family protein [Rhizobium sp. Root482]KQY26207.1 hypothetical protein ASD31_19580 [Rhizobium sp. Root482]
MADFSDDDDALLAELGVEVEAKRTSSRTPKEERIVAGFEEIQRFFEINKRLPHHGESADIFERLYAVRLDRIRQFESSRSIVEPIDYQGLLEMQQVMTDAELEELDDDALLAELGVEAAVSEITTLTHVRSISEKRAAEEIANRERCEDFDTFKPLFDQVQADLKSGARTTRPFVKDAGFLKAEITAGQFFVLGGQTVYVAEVGELIKAPNGETDARLRAIYSNGTESNILLRSLQRALYKDDTGRRITEATAGPLFADETDDGDLASGKIYVLRSKSENPLVAKNRDLIHKIGVTGGSVERRIANAKFDATFLLADVEIVATYELFNISRTKLENLIHRVFGAARLDMEIKDRFGKPVVPREWFLVPLFVIDEAVERIRDGSISRYHYRPDQAALVEEG